MPRPRAAGSTRSRRSFATSSGLPDQQRGADRSAVLLGDPAALPPPIVVARELRHDLRHQCLELLVEPVFLGVQRAVAVHDPAEIPRLVRTQDIRDPRLGCAAEQGLDRAHGLEQAALPAGRHLPEQRGDLVARGGIEQIERRLTVAGQGRWLWRPSVLERRFSTRPRRSKPRSMRLT